MAGVCMTAAGDDGSTTSDASPSSSTPPASGNEASDAGPEASVGSDVNSGMDPGEAAAAARASEAELRDALIDAANDADQLRSDKDALMEERLFILKLKREMHPDDWRRIFDPNNRRIGDFM